MELFSAKEQPAEIMVVDDLESNQRLLAKMIESMGYIAVPALSGAEAIEQIGRKLPQLFLLDITMPDMSGFELCEILKNNPFTKEIPVIFISAHDAVQDVVEGFSHGGADYITKPFIAEEVEARVGVHLRLYDMTRELMEMNRHLQVSISEQLKQMEMEKKNILYALADIATQNALYEKEYMKRLSKNSRTLAQGMQLSPLFEREISDTYIDAIELAASLCDIGNIGISTEILRKQTELTPEELEIRKGHTKLGAKLVSDLRGSDDYNDFINITMDIAHYHHENWDGTGYPSKKKGDDIPLISQIILIVDSYYAMISERPYRKAYTEEQALEEIKKLRGKKYSEELTDEFIHAIEDLKRM